MKRIAVVSNWLRWRHPRPGLLQREAPEQAGIIIPFYTDMETGICEHPLASVMDRLAALYDIQ